MFLGEFNYETSMPSPPRFGRELKEKAALAPGIEKYITTYPLSEWKKQAVCNFLVRMRFNGFKSESAVRQQR